MAEKSTKHYFRSYDVNEKLISNIDNGIIILDNELKIKHFNKWLEIHTSLKENDLLDKYIYDIFTNINKKTLQRKIKTALKMGTPTFYTASTSKYLIPIKINQIKISNFEHMRQDVSVIPFDIENKLIALIITDQTNITNTNNLLQSNIKKVQELNKELIKERETIDEKILLIKINNEYIINNVSHAYLELLNYKKSEIINQNLFDYEKSTISKKLKNNILKHIDEKKVLQFEKISIDKNGKEFWLQNTLIPEYNQSAKLIGFIIFYENITNAKLIQKHQEKLLANSRSSAMGEMISMIAHQWRQPLSVINTIIATLKIKKELDMLDEDSINTSYTKIENTVNYLSETIDDFRNFFKQNKELKTVRIKTIFEKSIHLLKDELIQSIINILKNSVDAFKENPKNEQKLFVSSYKEGKFIIIKIEDNAGGIKEEILSKIFEPYFSTKSKNGTGLGLYVCKIIIEEHLKGTLIIKSQDINTSVTIKLPKLLKTPEIST